ncbi:hypothetical protein GUITHDRAFT_148230 [Guillardia theta CCMP2712]|uniref:HECT-type E3 ubiquitin transferase n=1 Tax=Guillardia theta (strain CCMP2712) TaxID=905079 RepID=L1IAN8_GUITC|nr:hypothetical protein GUITHDRAFT_148230 [Guillardia theta CCMP2712]EKX32984.1 hypothetical protein GUITHDRAFT_148230 [Guillardia theta CCMP2712]|eukprot:XP_005819964.1 hypothetical protein GUITHDRAFT_148230 [Guillardia theta CCMP2712]
MDKKDDMCRDDNEERGLESSSSPLQGSHAASHNGAGAPSASKGGDEHMNGSRERMQVAGSEERSSLHGEAAEGGGGRDALPSYTPSPDYDSCRSLIYSYFNQITMGCGTVYCTNRNCFSCPEGPRLDPTSAALLAVKLAQSTTHFLCAGAAVTIPESLQWTEASSTSAELVPLKKLLQAATSAESNVSTQLELADAIKRCLSSSESASWSFLKNGRPCRANEESSGIDFDAVSEAFAAMAKCRKPIAMHRQRHGSVGVRGASEQAGAPPAGTGTSNKLEHLRMFVVLLLWPGLMEPEFYNSIFKKVCSSVNQLKQDHRDILQRWLEEVEEEAFREIVVAFQQFITIYVNEFRCIDDHVASATKVLKILWGSNQSRTRVSYKEFYNDAINELVDFTEDFARWKDTQRCPFSFCDHPFVLDPSTKSKLLQLDANNQMRTQIRSALFRSIFGGNECPYLILKVRRENLIRDTLVQISAQQDGNETFLKKPLKVVFKGEEGIDEGGVQKEFFQLIVRQMFDLNYGMFTYDDDSRTFWFSATALENAREFNLIGKVFGLAIYNSVILDVHFPMVVYKKLMGFQPCLLDLKDCNPGLARGLQSLLDFDGDVEEWIMRSLE